MTSSRGPSRYNPNPTPLCLQTKSAVAAKPIARPVPHPAPVLPQRGAAQTKLPPSAQRTANVIVAQTSGTNAIALHKVTTIQPMSFARFWKWGFLSNWGSYNATETDLLRRERDAQTFLSTLDRATRSRPRVRQLSRDLTAIAGSTIAERDYRATRDRLIQIDNELREEQEAQQFEEGLRRNREVFRQRGRPPTPESETIYPERVDDEIWGKLVGEMPRHAKKKWREGKNLPQLVEYLFRKFIGQEFNYNIMTSGAMRLIGSGVTSDTAEGNCVAYARAFADVLNSVGINAEAKMVRRDEDGRFIVRVDDFMDPTVPGHIYEKGALHAGYYMFSSHAATWVKSMRKYYDPMAKTSYTSLDPFIECELDSDRNEQVFYPTTRPKTLKPASKWKLVRKEKMLRGGFYRLELRPWEGGKS